MHVTLTLASCVVTRLIVFAQFLPNIVPRSRVRGDSIEPTFLSSIFLGAYKVSYFLLPSLTAVSKNLRQKLYVSITPTAHEKN
jgi:hypothetical protein